MSIYTKLFEVKKAGIKIQRDTAAFKYKYADLNQIQEKLNPVLQEQDLVIIHSVEDQDVVTRIHDIDYDNPEVVGFVESRIPIGSSSAQDKGSEITYYRRYNLLCLLDLETEDDDGKKATDSYNKPEKRTRKKNRVPESAYKKTLKALDDGDAEQVVINVKNFDWSQDPIWKANVEEKFKLLKSKQ